MGVVVVGGAVRFWLIQSVGEGTVHFQPIQLVEGAHVCKHFLQGGGGGGGGESSIQSRRGRSWPPCHSLWTPIAHDT